MDKVLLKKGVRDVLAAVPAKRVCTEEMIVAGLNRLVPFEVTKETAREAIEWNQERGFIDYRFDADNEVDSWFLTERGKAKA
jgi:hypothetical protein